MKTQTRAASAKARTIGLVRALKRNGLAKRRRKVPRTKYPLAIERAYAVEIARLVQGAMTEVRRQIEPELARWSEEFQNEARADAARADQSLPARVAAFVKRVANAFLEAIRPTALEDLARRFASRTNTWSREQTNKQVRAALGVDVFTAEPNLAPLVDAFLAENVALIRTVPQKFLEDVEGVVLRGVTSGTLPRDIAKQLVETEGVAERRAALIARDQVGKFYGRLNETRQRRLGGETYFWTTVGDNRVRPEHEEREGVEYAWTKEDARRLGVEYLPPEEQPGQPIACRCGAEMNADRILDALD